MPEPSAENRVADTHPCSESSDSGPATIHHSGAYCDRCWYHAGARRAIEEQIQREDAKRAARMAARAAQKTVAAVSNAVLGKVSKRPTIVRRKRK